MFPFFMPRSARQAARRGAKQATKALKATAKATRATARRTTSAAEALRVRPARRALGRFVEVDSVRVHYIVRGRGRPVVLLHGNGTMAEDFEICGLIDRLAERYRVIALDRPGFGRSTRPRYRTWTAHAQAELVHRVLERLKVERPLLVGHSWGTLVALALATGGQRELRGLVLLAGYYYPSRRADIALSRALANPWIGDAVRSLMPKALAPAVAARSFRHVFRPQRVPKCFEARFPVETAMGDVQLRASTEDAATMNAAAARLQSAYPRLRTPVAILTGGMDAIVDVDEQSRRLHADVPGSTLKVLPGLGHMVHYSACTAIVRTIDGLMQAAR